jgi:hypothetical protein
MYIVVLGSGKSGSSAVVNYLKGRDDIEKRFPKEFRLIQDPGGIIDLYASISDGFHMNRGSEAIKKFRQLASRYGRPINAIPKGLDYATHVTDYQVKVEGYLDRITAVKYNGMPLYEASDLPYWRAFGNQKLRKIFRKRFNKKLKAGTIYLPVDKQTFLNETRGFIDSILTGFETYNPAKKILVDQAGSFWTPVYSTQFFSECRVIVVTRDPRDVYSEYTYKGNSYPGDGVELFCNWYKSVMNHRSKSEWAHERVLHIRFEEFILNHSDQVRKICDHLDIDADLNSDFDPEQSKDNVEKFRNLLSKEDQTFIENELKPFLQL